MVTKGVHATSDLSYKSRDISTSLATSCSIFKPEAFQSIGNILFFVKPGIVFISFNKILFEDFSTKKSTLAKPKIFSARQLLIAIFLISFVVLESISAGMVILLFEL